MLLDRFVAGVTSNTGGANLAATLNQRDHGLLVFPATLDRHVFLAANIGSIGFNNTATGTHRGRVGVLHCMTDAMGHEPCSLVGNAQRAVQLVG